MNTKVYGLLEEIHRAVTRPIKVMEVCGGQTHAIAALGLEELLPPQLSLIHGPGCPVCVTSVEMIDAAVGLSLQTGVELCAYGDMMRVPGSKGDLLSAKARGACVKMIYSPSEAVKLAAAEPKKEVVFFAVGFETTAPATALAIMQARAMNLRNFSVLCAHVSVPPCLEWLMNQADGRPDGFLAPGHVCAVTGEAEYARLAEKYRMPMVITGFNAEDILRGLLMCARQAAEGEGRMRNAYELWVKPRGNEEALRLMKRVFMAEDRQWRGLGIIPKGGLRLRTGWAHYDAVIKFSCVMSNAGGEPATQCPAGQVLRGVMKPAECPRFGKSCTPMTPLGAPMVSSEGACAAYYKYKRNERYV